MGHSSNLRISFLLSNVILSILTTHQHIMVEYLYAEETNHIFLKLINPYQMLLLI